MRACKEEGRSNGIDCNSSCMYGYEGWKFGSYEIFVLIVSSTVVVLRSSACFFFGQIVYAF